MAATKKKLSADGQSSLLKTLQQRFEKNTSRHKGIQWADVAKKLQSDPAKLCILDEMELTGGEPDVVAFDKKTGQYHFFDCSQQTPKGRRSVCYDREGLESRKDHPPKDTATDMASAMGIEMLTEEQYQYLQTLGNFDTTTSSWLKTPPDVRQLGGAIFGDYRFGRVFIYHNGAGSYYAVRGFRGALLV